MPVVSPHAPCPAPTPRLFSVALVLFAGVASGLTVGLLSFDTLQLSILQMEGSAQDKRRAARIKPLIEQHHFLLCTLLLANAAAMEALPIFLDEIVPSYLAIIISVTAVLMFGEIIPQAVCTGPNKLCVAAGLSYFVRFLMLVEFPIAWPLGKVCFIKYFSLYSVYVQSMFSLCSV